MIFVTGDCHGEWGRLGMKNFPEQRKMTKDDCVIVCGDFGFWTPSREREYWMDWLERKPFTTLFVDGNHENFDGLYQLKEEMWKQGRVHRIRDSVIHLMRGQVFVMEGYRFFTFGGARSHDIQGGILEPGDPEFRRKKKAADQSGLFYRVDHESWWRQEMPSREERDMGLRKLEACDWKVDFVITHCCSSDTQALLTGGSYEADELTEYFENIRGKLRFRKWFFGHYHMDREINPREMVVYEQILRVF